MERCKTPKVFQGFYIFHKHVRLQTNAIYIYILKNTLTLYEKTQNIKYAWLKDAISLWTADSACMCYKRTIKQKTQHLFD